MNAITQNNVAYLAGLLDGEGCLAVRKSGNNLHKSIEVCMTNPNPLQWAKRVTNTGCLSKRKESRVNRKDVWHLVISKSADLIELLTAVKPYLKVKYPDACIVKIAALLSAKPGQRRQYKELDARLTKLSTLVKAL